MTVPRRRFYWGPPADSTALDTDSGVPPPASDEEQTTVLLKNLHDTEMLRWRRMTSLKGLRTRTLLGRLLARIR